LVHQPPARRLRALLGLQRAGHPNTYRDTSAAAVAASALFQLATLATDPAAKARDLAAATNILGSLATQKYLAEGTPSHGVLIHGANNVPANDAPDASLSWGDYYFVEALNRYTAAVG
jgi:unsaturated chondroitin disaccharide hydrolase